MATYEMPFADVGGIRPSQEVNSYQQDAAGVSSASFDDILLHLSAKRDDANVNDLAWRLFSRQATTGPDVPHSSPPSITQNQMTSAKPNPKERKPWIKRKRVIKDSSKLPKSPLVIAVPPAEKTLDGLTLTQTTVPKSYPLPIAHLPTTPPTAHSNPTTTTRQSHESRTEASAPMDRCIASTEHDGDANDRIVAWRDDVLQPDTSASEESPAWQGLSPERRTARFTRLRLTPSLEVDGYGRGLLSMVITDDEPLDEAKNISPMIEPVPLRQPSSSSTKSSVSGPTLSTPSIAVDRSGAVSPIASPDPQSDAVLAKRSNLKQRHVSQAASFCFIGADEFRDTASMYNRRQHHISRASTRQFIREREQYDTISIYSKRTSFDGHEQNAETRYEQQATPMVSDAQRAVGDLRSQLSRQLSIASPVHAGVFDDATTSRSKTDKPLPPPPPPEDVLSVPLLESSSLKPVVPSAQSGSENTEDNGFQSMRRSRLSRPFSPFEMPEFLQTEDDIAEESEPTSPVELPCPDQAACLAELREPHAPTELPGSTIPPSPTRLPNLPGVASPVEPPSPTASQAEKDLLEQLSAITQVQTQKSINNGIDSPTLGSFASIHAHENARKGSQPSEQIHPRLAESGKEGRCTSASEEYYIEPIVPKIRQHVRSESSLDLLALHGSEGHRSAPAPTRSVSLDCVELRTADSTENLYDGSARGEPEYEQPRIGMRDFMELLRDENFD